MTDKRLTVILYGCDRNLWGGGPLEVRVADVFASGGPRTLYQGRTEASTLELRLQLPFDAGQVYGFTFSAPHHRPAWQLVRRLDFIQVREQVEGDDLILSIDGSPLLSFVRAVSHVAVDRAFLLFDAGLKARMPRSIDFAGAPGHAAPKNMSNLGEHPDSWKHTHFTEGNVQLSFSKEAVAFLAAGPSSMAHSADIDIDLGRGLAHAKEWLENNVFRPGHKTNQAPVYALLYTQGILPQYTLDPAPSTTVRRGDRRRLE